MTIEMMSNLESIGDLVGALAGLSEGLEDDQYMESLIRQAHGQASNAFDVAAAATAATGHLKHVFEFGVAGITEGQIKFTDPTTPAARLWTHQIVGRGGNMDIGYTFRPALNRNPRPTTARTGVASKYLRKLSRRKYVFWNKAFVMETGQEVEIRAKRGNYLFVPFNNQPSRDPLNRKGFVMWNSNKLGPIKATPGQSTKGTFSAFWMRWWAGQGSTIVEESMSKAVRLDVEKAMAAATKKAAAETLKPAQATNIAGAAKAASSETRKFFRRKS